MISCWRRGYRRLKEENPHNTKLTLNIRNGHTLQKASAQFRFILEAGRKCFFRSILRRACMSAKKLVAFFNDSVILGISADTFMLVRCSDRKKTGKRASRTVEIPERSRLVQGFDGSCPNPSRSFGREAIENTAEIPTEAPVIMGR